MSVVVAFLGGLLVMSGICFMALMKYVDWLVRHGR